MNMFYDYQPAGLQTVRIPKKKNP